MTKPADIDAYIAGFPEETQLRLQEVRGVVRKNAPGAEEKISYGMPAYLLKGKPVVYFAAFRNHLGFYPTPNGVETFNEELSHYKTGKGSVQFPLDQPMPLDFIRRIVEFRVKNVNEKA